MVTSLLQLKDQQLVLQEKAMQSRQYNFLKKEMENRFQRSVKINYEKDFRDRGSVKEAKAWCTFYEPIDL